MDVQLAEALCSQHERCAVTSVRAEFRVPRPLLSSLTLSPHPLDLLTEQPNTQGPVCVPGKSSVTHFLHLHTLAEPRMYAVLPLCCFSHHHTVCRHKTMKWFSLMLLTATASHPSGNRKHLAWRTAGDTQPGSGSQLLLIKRANRQPEQAGKPGEHHRQRR